MTADGSGGIGSGRGGDGRSVGGGWIDLGVGRVGCVNVSRVVGGAALMRTGREGRSCGGWNVVGVLVRGRSVEGRDGGSAWGGNAGWGKCRDGSSRRDDEHGW